MLSQQFTQGEEGEEGEGVRNRHYPGFFFPGKIIPGFSKFPELKECYFLCVAMETSSKMWGFLFIYLFFFCLSLKTLLKDAKELFQGNFDGFAFLVWGCATFTFLSLFSFRMLG